MKLSSKILVTMLVLFVASIGVSNFLFKLQYDQVDKSDLYWNYNKILEQPFKHLKIDGGNVTNIVFEQNNHFSVRVLNYWGGYQKDSVKAFVRHDTLVVRFLNTYANLIDKSWMQSKVLVRIAAPQLLSVEGNDTNFELAKLKQKSLKVSLSGKSRIEIESLLNTFDTLDVRQQDSSQVLFSMSPDVKGSKTIAVKKVNARLKGVTLLDIGHAKVDKINALIEDTSAIILSGRTYNVKNQLDGSHLK